MPSRRLTNKERIARAEQKAERSAAQVRAMQSAYNSNKGAQAALISVLGALPPYELAAVVRNQEIKHAEAVKALSERISRELSRSSKMQEGYEKRIRDLEGAINEAKSKLENTNVKWQGLTWKMFNAACQRAEEVKKGGFNLSAAVYPQGATWVPAHSGPVPGGELDEAIQLQLLAAGTVCLESAKYGDTINPEAAACVTPAGEVYLSYDSAWRLFSDEYTELRKLPLTEASDAEMRRFDLLHLMLKVKPEGEYSSVQPYLKIGEDCVAARTHVGVWLSPMAVNILGVKLSG